MGVLDDAIRDHLDLKRRRGADPAEIELAEREALGPVRRGPEPVADEAPVAADLPYDDEYDDEEVAAPPFESRPAGGRDEDELWADELEPEWEDEPDDEHPPLAFEPGPPAAGATAPAPPRAPTPEPAPAVPDPHPAPSTPPASDETVEYRVSDALGHEGRPGEEREDEDVLEETPEFLQDTPDHDRLWFEQRPPRDFDFDG